MNRAEMLSFTMATLYIPLILIGLLYLPSVLYVVKISVSLFGWRGWLGKTLENPVFFILPIFTSLSFYRKTVIEAKALVSYVPNTDSSGNETLSLEDIETTGSTDEVSRESLDNKQHNETVQHLHDNVKDSTINDDPSNKMGKELSNKFSPNFSLLQSNFLFTVYFIGSFLIIFADLYLQKIKYCPNRYSYCR